MSGERCPATAAGVYQCTSVKGHQGQHGHLPPARVIDGLLIPTKPLRWS